MEMDVKHKGCFHSPLTVTFAEAGRPVGHPVTSRERRANRGA